MEFQRRALEAIENDCAREKNKLCGARVDISLFALKEMLPIEGDLRGIQYNPATQCVEFYYTGDKDHFPEIQEGEVLPQAHLLITTELNQKTRKRDITKLEISTPGFKGVHWSREEDILDEEANKEEVYCTECYGQSRGNIEAKTCYQKKEDCPYQEGRNYCARHPQGICPRFRGDCEGCQYK
jgi:hypothetical protein